MTVAIRVTEQMRKPRALRLRFWRIDQPGTNLPVGCPAGTPIYETKDGSAVYCAIEKNVLSALREPSTLEHFCCGNYAICTSWQHQKEWIAEGLRSEALDDKRGMIDTARYRSDLVEMGTETEVTYFEAPE